MDNNDAQFVGSIPEHYDRGLGPVLFADFAADMARRVAALSPGRVLETAAGTGIVTRALRDHLASDAELTATDLNPPMLEIAKGKFGPADRVGFRVDDAQALSFADGSFDAMVCQFGIMFFPDKAKGYSEAFRVLAPGGRYLFSVWDSHRYNGFARLADELVHTLFAENPPGFYSVPFNCSAIDPIKAALLEAGFTDIEINVLRIDQTVDDLARFATGMVFGNPLVDQIRARGTMPPDEVNAALYQAYAKEFGSNPATIPLQTITFSARKPA